MCKKYNIDENFKSKTFIEAHIEDIKNDNTVKNDNNIFVGMCYCKSDYYSNYIAVLPKSYFEREKNKTKDYFLFDEYMELDK